MGTNWTRLMSKKATDSIFWFGRIFFHSHLVLSCHKSKTTTRKYSCKSVRYVCKCKSCCFLRRRCCCYFLGFVPIFLLFLSSWFFYEFSCQENVRNICSVVNHKLFTQCVWKWFRFFSLLNIFHCHRSFKWTLALAILSVCMCGILWTHTIKKIFQLNFTFALIVWDEPHTKHDQIEPHFTQIDDVRTVSNAHM